MRVLLTGGAGYIGNVMARHLLDRGFEVVVLDRLFFGVEPVRDLISEKGYTLVHDDVRWFDPSILNGVDIVVDMAAIANDPAGELNPEFTMDINYRGRVRVANLARKHRVRRYIYFSTCSVYGYQEGMVDERSHLNPLTTYAKASALGEKEILPLSSEDFIVTIVRPATVYGYSPRLRLDLVVNTMTFTLFTEGKVKVFGGTQYRPLVHVRDVARAVEAIINTEPEKVNGEIFNVGSDEQNYRILDLAREICKVLGRDPDECIELRPQDVDIRSYRVSFAKIRTKLGFIPKYTIADGVREVWNALDEGRVKPSTKNWTVRRYREILERFPDILAKPLNIILP
ncbi:MAG: SDR family NAD-dependent epimerase/dehydratase [Candidatus Aenigmatarchaeota archaeon]|nr:MAG: SDR family NAD-dependent epimerase/dehydratase [Candidatus Aenigmarchaeota archaeon]